SETASAGSTNVYKQVFVLHPGWQGKMHGLDMKNMTEAERVVIKTVMNPNAENMRTHRIPLINDILKRMDPPELIKNPMSFYNQFVKPFIRNKDMYRTYHTMVMTGIQVIDQSKVEGNIFNPKPLFGKPLGS
ncbi:hypothetical protein KAT92_05110, partial [Candidatus Babeliales bacterium]|nr:hypothetical protein [Candidatus Babeliales bacterium]